MSSIPTCLCSVCGASFDVPKGRGRARKYCGANCREKAYRRRRSQERATYAPCELEDCDAPRRSRKARWCEAHYIRWYRHGDPQARVSTAREPNGLCFHCGGTAPDRNIFCSSLCRTRDRIGADPELRKCPVCDAPVPFTNRADRVYCTAGCGKEAARARQYGLTVDQYRSLRTAHGGACAICGAAAEVLHIDHCHDSGKVRGLLCQPCNFGLGNFSDDVDRMLRAIEYLRGHRSR